MVSEYYTFGPHKIHRKLIFYTTNLSYAMVNLRPVVPDVLAIPKREVKRFVDLSRDEICDLWLTTQLIGGKLELFHNASSLTLNIQMDENDRVMKQHIDLDEKRKDRSFEEMAQEADQYTRLFF